MSYRKKHIKSKIHKTKAKKPIFRQRFFWIFILVLVLIFTASYFLLFFSDFQVKNIIISGNEKIQAKDVKNLVSDNINKKIISIGKRRLASKSIFLTNLPELQQKITSAFPVIENVQVSRKFPHNVIIQIKERKPVAIFCQPDQAEKCFFIDKNGVIFEKLQDALLNMPILKRLLGDKGVLIGKNVIEKDIMSVVLKIEKNLKDNFQIDIKEALLSDLSSSIKLDIKTNENWQIYFDLNSDIDLQIVKLNSLLKEEIFQNSRIGLQYIDLRFKNRAYYK